MAALLAAALPVLAETDVWKAIGPEGGTVTALAVDPQNAGIVYAGTDQAGLWKSANGGASWAPANSGITGGSITAVAVDPSHSGVVYVGTGASGVFKSIDAGASWAPASQGLATGSVAALAVDPVANEILWVSILSGTGFTSTFESTDAASSWIAKSPGVRVVVTAILLHAHAIYLGTTGGFPTEYILKSTDAGETWMPLAISGVTTPITGFTFDPSAPATLYAGTIANGVFKSSDGGASWSAAGKLVNPHVSAVATDPDRSGTVYAATQAFYDSTVGRLRSGGVFKSSDGGSTWQRAGQGMPLTSTQVGTNTLCLAVDPANPGVVYAGNAVSGVFKSTNHARRWSRVVHGLRGLAIAKLAVDPKRPSTIYAGTPIAGLYRSTDGGTTWQQLIADTGVLSITLDPVRSRTVYVGTDTGLSRSRDGGNSFAELHPGSLAGDVIGPLAIDPTQRSILYGAGFFGVFRSVDFGDTWSPPANMLPCLQPLTIVVDPSAPNHVYVGGTDTDAGCSFIYPNVLLDESRDGGVHWSQIGHGLGDFNSLVIDAATATFYAALGGGVYKSADAGASWQSTNLPARSHEVDVVLLDLLSPGAIYAGDFASGVLWSPDGGATWARLADPLDQRSVADIALEPGSTTTLYAATAGGLFRVTRQP